MITKSLGLLLAVGVGLPLAAQAAPTPTASYSVSTFGSAPAGATNPDSIVVSGNDVFVGYANDGSKTGANNNLSTIAEFNDAGSLLNTFSVVGHNDGLRVDPSTGLLWAMQNEDANPSLVIINTLTSAQNVFNLPSQDTGGQPGNMGGLDDIVFQNGSTYFSVSNAQSSLPNNPDPVIVKATQTANGFSFAPIFAGNVTIPNSATGASSQQNLTDADSLTTIPGTNHLLLTDQTANELVTVVNPGQSNQSASFVPTTDNTGAAINVDDTIFPGGQSGSLLVSDTNSDNIYAISGNLNAFAYSAAPDAGFVGSLNLGTGQVTPIVNGFTAPKGMAFLPNAAAVPEPGSLSLVAGGLLLLLGGVRRRVSRR